MKLNNKGFAVSVILYSISALIIVILFLILAITSAGYHNVSNQANEIKKELSGIDYTK